MARKLRIEMEGGLYHVIARGNGRQAIERRADSIRQLMHRVLTGYTQDFNRRNRRVGHVLQGRHKAILSQLCA